MSMTVWRAIGLSNLRDVSRPMMAIQLNALLHAVDMGVLQVSDDIPYDQQLEIHRELRVMRQFVEAEFEACKTITKMDRSLSGGPSEERCDGRS